MKRFFHFASIIMLASLAAACGKDNGGKNNGKNNGNGNEGVSGKSSIAITIDGKFDDWDKITAETAAKDDFVAIVKADDPEATIQVIKTNSDTKNVYFYAEMLVDGLPQNAICSEWGDSYNGTPEKGYKGDGADNDKFGDVFNLFFDPDGNEKTGFYTYANDEGEAAIPGLGCEQCSQINFFWNYQTNKLCVAWNQTNIGPETIGGEPYNYDGDFFQQSEWNADDAVPQWGWQNFAGDGKGDNIAPKPENIASAANGGIVKVEFAIEKSDIVNLEDDAVKYAWGVCYRFGDPQDIGPIAAQYSE